MEGEGLKGDEAREREVILFILSFFLSPQFLFPVFLSCPRNLSYLVSFIAFVFYLFSLSFFLPFPFSALRPFSLPTFLSFSPIFSLSFSLFPTLPPFSPLFWKCFSFLSFYFCAVVQYFGLFLLPFSIFFSFFTVFPFLYSLQFFLHCLFYDICCSSPLFSSISSCQSSFQFLSPSIFISASFFCPFFASFSRQQQHLWGRSINFNSSLLLFSHSLHFLSSSDCLSCLFNSISFFLSLSFSSRRHQQHLRGRPINFNSSSRPEPPKKLNRDLPPLNSAPKIAPRLSRAELPPSASAV